MRVIKSGWVQQDYPIEHTCSVCGCVYEYNVDDIHATDEREGVYFGVVFCPTCKNSHHVTCSKETFDKAWEAMFAREYRLALLALAAKNEEDRK